MYMRNLMPALREAWADSPVVMLNGPRQAGKSTLAQALIAEQAGARYLTLDDASVLSAIATDAAGFLAGLEGPVVLDEIQRAPEFFVAIKAAVDRDRRPGRFFLTGSADVLLLPRVSESLAGRVELFTLWPLSQGEIEGRREAFVDAAFGAGALPPGEAPLGRDELIARLVTGGYPEALRRSAARRRAWFDAYVTTILQRDVRELANIEGLTQMPRLLSLLAARTASLLNFAELSRSSGLPQTTLKRYMALLEMTFLVRTLPAWSGNLSKRLVKSPKVFLCDTGLASSLLDIDAKRAEREGGLLGALLESFVVTEIMKQAAWSEVQPQLFHYRSQAGQEIDVLLEDRQGRLVGIEIKARQTASAEDFKGLKDLQESLPARFHRGIVLYAGQQSIPFGEKLQALPISSLWQSDAMATLNQET